MRVTLLGTGASIGAPVIGCSCSVCTSTDPRDKRTRCSCIIQTRGLNILVDAGPDCRQQVLREGIARLDAVLLTHHHFDHVGGMDDLRPYFFHNRQVMSCHANERTQKTLRQMFPWIFGKGSYTFAPRLRLQSCDRPFRVSSRYGGSGSVRVTPVPLLHGRTKVVGYRIGRFAYLTDASEVPWCSYQHLENLDLLVLDALEPWPHRRHFSIGEAVEVAAEIGARRTVFVHMTHRVSHAEVDALLPAGVMLGYDGLSMDIQEHL